MNAIPIIPVSNLERGIEFYEGKVGLELEERNETLPENREARFKVGPTALVLYESVGAGQSRHTLAGLEVDDIEATVAEMGSRGVVFEEYDLPDLKTEGGIASIGNTRGAWFRDPDGNILAVESRVPATAPVA